MTDSMSPENRKTDEHYDLYAGAISQDPVATVLRFHLLTEYYLEQMIKLVLPRGDRLVDSAAFSYAQKLGIVHASDLIPDTLISSLRNLNKIRNKCSHELNHQISNSDLEIIGSPFGKMWTDVKREHESTEDRLSSLCGLISVVLGVELDDMEIHFHGEQKSEDKA